jgi:hypothetical protein
MKPPDDPHDEERLVNDDELTPRDVAPAAVEEPGIDFQAMLGGSQDLALYVVVGDDSCGGERRRARVGRYERRDP